MIQSLLNFIFHDWITNRLHYFACSDYLNEHWELVDDRLYNDINEMGSIGFIELSFYTSSNETALDRNLRIWWRSTGSMGQL